LNNYLSLHLALKNIVSKNHYNLQDDFKLNIENNHATLAGHTYAHEVQTAYNHKAFGSLDINQGDHQNGWDTDEFLVDLYDATKLMLVILSEGGIGSAGMNFDAKTRRSSTDLQDLFIGHINSMDTLARGLLIADNMLQNSDYLKLKNQRYHSFTEGYGASFAAGKLSLAALAECASELGEPDMISGKQEHFEGLLNSYIK